MKHCRLVARVYALILITCLILPTVTSCGKMSSLHSYSATYLDDTFDTVLAITIGAENADDANEHCRAIKALVSDLHRQFDAYHVRYGGSANIAAINASAVGTPVRISDDVMAILKLGKEAYARTDGAVHIGMGILTGMWKDAIADKTLPNSEEVACVLAKTPSLDAMVLDEQNGSVTLTEEGLRLDVGSIAKGYVLERVRAYAEEHGITSLLCNLGGEILAVGTAPDGKAWKIAIADPNGGTLQTIALRDAVVATGGDYERCFTVDGRRYHHIVDPSTGYPSVNYRAATVVLPLEAAGLSDAYSTALMIMSKGDGQAMASHVSGLAYLRVYPDGTMETNAEWQENMP